MRARANMAYLLAWLGMLATAAVRADSEYFVVPSITVSELYDDNIFFSLEDEESAYITRVSPALALGYEARKLTATASYRVDAEDYRDHHELDSKAIRRFVDAAAEYLPSNRLTLAVNADYTKTDTPVDISLVPGGEGLGLVIGRAEAERTSLRPSAHYRFTRTVTGSLAYAKTLDKLSGGAESDINTSEADIERKLSPRSAISAGYIYRDYRFDNAVSQVGTTTIRDDTHTPWLGLLHDINPNTGVVARVGARLSGHITDPYLQIALRWQHPTGQFQLRYERDETILLGGTNRQQFETLSAVISRQFGYSFSIVITPAYTQFSQLPQGAGTSGVAHVAVEAKYRINNAVHLTGAINSNYQQVDFVGGTDDEVSRNVIQFGITFAYPRRTRNDAETEYDF